MKSRGYFQKHARDKITVLPSHFYEYRLDEILDSYEFGDEIMEGLRVAVHKISGIKRIVKIEAKDTSPNTSVQNIKRRIDI